MGQAPHSHSLGHTVASVDTSVVTQSPLSRLENELGDELARFLVGALSNDLLAPREES